MRKNKSKKAKVPVLDEKSYAEYLDYLKREDYSVSRENAKSEGQGRANVSKTDEKVM